MYQPARAAGQHTPLTLCHATLVTRDHDSPACAAIPCPAGISSSGLKKSRRHYQEQNTTVERTLCLREHTDGHTDVSALHAAGRCTTRVKHIPMHRPQCALHISCKRPQEPTAGQAHSSFQVPKRHRRRSSENAEQRSLPNACVPPASRALSGTCRSRAHRARTARRLWLMGVFRAHSIHAAATLHNADTLERTPSHAGGGGRAASRSVRAEQARSPRTHARTGTPGFRVWGPHAACRICADRRLAAPPSRSYGQAWR